MSLIWLWIASREQTGLLLDDPACYPFSMSSKPQTHTMWTAPVSRDVPVLRELDMNAPISGVAEARARAAESEEELKQAQSFYVSRSSAASLRKLVK